MNEMAENYPANLPVCVVQAHRRYLRIHSYMVSINQLALYIHETEIPPQRKCIIAMLFYKFQTKRKDISTQGNIRYNMKQTSPSYSMLHPRMCCNQQNCIITNTGVCDKEQ